ncbi:ArnT family glycosyltransferase [Arthrobacter bambusae]|uniref:ArnT family glycosyltransferase n=1 Tax=Arthrobacter bambusae TaxID=1338426 RepID=UPI00278B854F|nr:glycosyltransferase family 39 protein [Arthrobacter bambusae]MDQ0030869.1 4-amino-4-deoxy-L-arabinose transferase-like glycosyltransferase [Arthrobacter bambusae]MDQ0099234.1 4-amino-4-deoxy-L-arabinose transferase-like glycosyltransferase [Arthrobacter bambusae]
MTTSYSTDTASKPVQPAPTGSVEPQVAATPQRGGGRNRSALTRKSRRDPNPHALRHRVELGFVLLATAVLYLWNLGASGWANPFYSAAAQAGSQNWTAWFFGSSDAANSITVDKPPASLWIMDLSVRIFGLSSWSILVPEALMGVATAWLLYLAVRRAAAPATGDPRLAHRAGLLAAVVLAITPVATLIFRFNNPDALLVLLMTAAGYATLRSIQDNKLRWLLLAGVCLGFGFLTKQLQVLLVVPGFALAYLVAAPGGVGRRLLRLLGAGTAMVVSASWWLAAVELIPANMRPYIGGSQNNSILELTLGYNGFGRLSGQETGSVGGGNGWGVPGLFRMFNSEFGGQIAWLLPSVLVLGAALLWLGRRAPRTDSVRASVIVWGSWVFVTGLVFSFMAGIIHPYYAVALAPGIAGLAGLGGVLLWQHRAQPVAAVMLAAAVAAAGITTFGVLGGTNAYAPLFRWAVLLGALVAAAGLVLSGRFTSRILQRTTAVLALAASLAGPLVYSISTASVTHSGAIPSAGPTITFGGFGAGGFGGRGGFGASGLGQNTGQNTGQNAAQNTPPQALQQPGTQGGGFGGNRQGGGMAGLLGATTPSSAMVAALKTGASNYTWAAAVVGSNNAAGYQLATGLPVMAVGGFNGTDPSPTLEQFQQLVAQGKIHYFIAGGTMQATSGSDAPARIAEWVAANFQTQTIGGTTVYGLAR